MRTYLIRLLEALLDVRSSALTPQRAVLEVALEIQRLGHRLFEICDSLSLPADVGKMREARVPRTVAAELYGIVEMVKADYLEEAVASLLKVAQVTEEEIREEFFEQHGVRL
jgi:hypothetical protein